MDCDMAESASLVLRGLVVEARGGRRSDARIQGVAADAQQIDLILLEHPLVCRAVRRMANGATLELGFVLVHEGPLLVSVALVANFVIAVGSAKLAGQETTVRIVAVATLEQPFVYAVVKRPGELGANIQMAAIAEFRRRFFQQELRFPGVVGRVAINAGHSVFQMSRPPIIVVLLAILVASQATSTGLGGRSILKGENLCFVATTVDVCFAGSMACFAAFPSGSLLCLQLSFHGGGEVWIVFKPLGNLLMARLASVWTHVERGVGWGNIALLFSRLFWRFG